MSLARLKVAFAALGLEGRAKKAERREASALVKAGEHVFAALRAELDTGALVPRASELVAKLRLIETQAATLSVGLEESLARDRDDFARASQAMRWVVVVRGVFDRILLRGDLRRQERERPALERELGRVAFDGEHPTLRALVPDAIAKQITDARADAASARTERAKSLKPFGGQPLPGWLGATLHEVRVFLGFVWEQLSKKFFLRAPALAGLLVGWWLGRSFSSSEAATWVHQHIGLDVRDRGEVETKARLAFWLPLFAAALCSYIAAFVALRVQRKYAPETERAR
jgi:hypothetical protein